MQNMLHGPLLHIIKICNFHGNLLYAVFNAHSSNEMHALTAHTWLLFFKRQD